MVNLIMKEIMTVMNTRQVTGESLTPRHQGKVESSHQVLMRNRLILMHKVTNAFPQEWPALVPALEYLYVTCLQGRYGLLAEDMSCGYALATSRDLLLKPFSAPDGMTETDIATTLFKQFMYLIFSGCLQGEAKMSEMRITEDRRPRKLYPGDVVNWELPYAARASKHFFPEPNDGPYAVVRQPTTTCVVV